MPKFTFNFELPNFTEVNERGLDGIEKRKLMLSEPKIYEDEAQVGETFSQDEYWHIDTLEGTQIRNVDIHLWASSTPTEFAACEIDVDSSDFGHFYRADGSYLLNLAFDLATSRSRDWLEIAGGLVKDPEKKELLDRFVRVRDLVLVQAMPKVVVMGDVKTTLHRAAKRHESQPAVRLFERAFTF